jgi:helix-turn-helix protein
MIGSKERSNAPIWGSRRDVGPADRLLKISTHLPSFQAEFRPNWTAVPILSKISPSHRTDDHHALDLVGPLIDVHKASAGTYGYQRVTAVHHGRDIVVGHNTAGAIMREIGLKGLRPAAAEGPRGW